MIEPGDKSLNGDGADAGESEWGELASDLEALRRQIESLQAMADRQLRALTSERPLLALGAAVAIGFVFGRALRRR